MRSLVRLASVSLSICMLWFAAPALAADGAALYEAQGAGCHGPDGKAATPAAKAMKVPALAGKTISAEALANQLRTNEKHKALSTLTDEEIAAIAGALPH